MVEDPKNENGGTTGDGRTTDSGIQNQGGGQNYENWRKDLLFSMEKFNFAAEKLN